MMTPLLSNFKDEAPPFFSLLLNHSECISSRGVVGWRSESLVGSGLHLILCMPKKDDSVGPEAKKSHLI